MSSTLRIAFVTLIFCQSPAFGAEAGSDDAQFNSWLADLRAQAIELGIARQVVASALDGLTLDPRVIGFDRNQPEFVQTFEEYLDARVSRDRVKTGRELFHKHLVELTEVGDFYGVEPQIILAFWGLESSFGRYQGKYQVVRSLATLAFDTRRADFFRGELLDALRILDQGHVAPDEFVGGWAGAMGQNQFIPSSFLNYAQDFDGDGKKNIWSSQLDVWASIAYYLKKNGWQKGQGWGTKVVYPQHVGAQLYELKPEQVSSRCRALKYHTRKLSSRDWQQLGIRGSDGADLPDTPFKSAMIVPEEMSSANTSYLTYPNFRAILSYNCANKYAVSIGLFADLMLQQ